MALRFYLPNYSLPRGGGITPEEWSFELWDSEFSGTATEADGRAQAAEFNWEGDNDLVPPIMPSSLTYWLLINDASEVGILTALAGAKRGRFKLVARRAGSSEVYWAGKVQTDHINWPNDYYPFHIELFATDGIADLKDIDYKAPDGDPYEGSATFMEHIVNIIEKIDNLDVGTWPTDLIRSTANWYEDGMDTAESPLTQAILHHDCFTDLDPKGNDRFWNTYTVLASIMQAIGCQFLHENGQYHIRQIEAYKNTTNKAHYFDATGTLTSTAAAENVDIEVDYTTDDGMRVRAGGLWIFLQPLKKVTVDYHHRTNHNRATGQQWNQNDEDWSTLPGIIYVPEADKTYARGSVKIRHKSWIGVTTPGTIWPVHRYRFLIQVRFLVSGSYYYLKRESATGTVFYDLQPGEMEWEIGAATSIKVWGPQVTQADNLVDKFFTFSFTTPFFLTSFDGLYAEMRVQLDGVEKTDGTDLVLSSPPYQGNINDWNTQGVTFIVEDEGNGNNPDAETLRFETETTGDNVEQRTIDTYIGDGPAPFSLSTIHIGGSPPSNAWQVNGTGTSRSLAALLGHSVMQFRQKPQLVFQGAYLHKGIRPIFRFVDVTHMASDVGMMATSIRLSVFENSWSGDFVVMDSDVDNIFTAEPHIPDTRLPSGPPNYPGVPPNLPQGPQTPTPYPDFPPLDGFIGGTLPGFVEMAEQSITKLTASITSTAFASSHSLTVTAVGYSWVTKGDQITLIDPTTRHRETFTVDETPLPLASSIKIKTSESMTKDFPYGSLVKLTPKTAGQVKGWSYYQRNVSGTLWEIPGSAGILPTVANYDEQALRQRVKVWRGGIMLIYDPDTSYDDSFHIQNTDPQKIIFHFECRGENMYLEVR